MSKKYLTGLVIGKFYPLHKGHQYLIETALAKTEQLSVIVTHTPLYEISAEVRASWIKTLYPEADVRIFFHEPSMDNPSPNKSEIWAKKTVEFLGFVPEVVFTSEDYGDAYCKFMGSKHVVVDKAREKYPVSGTLLRNNIKQYLEYLDPVVQEYFKLNGV